MGRPPCCDKLGVKKGPWTPEEDIMLVSYVQEHGPGNWRAVPTITGLRRCSKSCRLRWANYLRPGIKRGNFTDHEEKMIIQLQDLLGNKWAAIASYLPDRTDNDIKNYWNIHLKKKLKKVEGPEIPNGFINPRGQWETRLQADIKTAKQALEDALSYEKGFTYASSTENIARLLKHWNPPKSEQSSISSTTTQHSFANNNPSSFEQYWNPPKSEQSSISSITTQNSYVNNPTSSSNSPEFQAETKQDTTPLSMLENWLLDESAISGTDLLFDENQQLF